MATNDKAQLDGIVKMFGEFDSMRDENFLTDVSLIADDLELKCHKIVLSAASPYFKAMFTSEMKEAKSGKVEFSTINGLTLKTVVQFIYTNQTDIKDLEDAQVFVQAGTMFQLAGFIRLCEEYMINKIDNTSVVMLASFADLLNLSSLRKACESFMGKNLNDQNIKTFTNTAVELKLETLVEKCEQFMIKNLDSSQCYTTYLLAQTLEMKELEEEAHAMWMKTYTVFKETPAFLELEHDVLVNYLSHEDLSKGNENNLLHSILNWTCHNKDDRQEHLECLLQDCVDLEKCSPSVLVNCLKDNMDLLVETHSLKMFVDAQCFQMSGTLIAIESERLAGKYDKRKIVSLSSKGKWDKVCNLKDTYLIMPSICVAGSSIVITGGQKKKDSSLYECWSFSIENRKWSRLPSLEQRRHSHGCVSVNDHLYVLGGVNEKGYIRSVEELESPADSTYNRWAMIEPMIQTGYYYIEAVAFERTKLFVFSRGLGNSTQQYNIKKRTWSMKAPMPHDSTCTEGNATVFGENIYIIGKLCASSKYIMMRYSPYQDKWENLKAPLGLNVAGPAVVWKEKLYVLGGKDEERVHRAQIYDLEKKNWKWSDITPSGSLKIHSVFAYYVAGDFKQKFVP